jgi:hypothetical protein
MGRYVVNIVVGTLEIENSKRFLLSTSFIPHNNSIAMNQTINDALVLLWPKGIQYDKILLLITDRAKYMRKLGSNMKNMYPKLIHLTCLAHAMHNVSEKIREYFINVDKFISSVKKVFKKSPKRIQKFKLMAPNLALPPQPVITRWGTWILAAKYYSENFNIISDIIGSFKAKDSKCIKDAKKCLEDSNLKYELAFINANFSSIVDVITILEVKDLSIVDAITIIEEFLVKLSRISNSEVGKIAYERLKLVLEANPGYTQIKTIAHILNGTNFSDNLDVDLEPHEIAAFRSAPATSCDVERSFSQYKSVLNDKRCNFTDENLKKYFVSHFNLNLL